jgi:hypothetical protein
MILLNYRSNERFALVFPEQIPLSKYRIVIGYYEEFKKAIALDFYPLERGYSQIEKWMWLLNLIGQEIDPNIDWHDIEYADLYAFFIASIEVVEGKSPTLSHSNLEKLLGFEDDKAERGESKSASTPTSELITTGDILLDVATATLLNFKQGFSLLSNYSLNQLLQMNKYANALQEKASKEAEEKYNDKKTNSFAPPPVLAPQALDPMTASIVEKIEKKGISVPKRNSY